MLDAETVGDRTDGLTHEKEERMQRQRGRAGFHGQFAGEHLHTSVDHVKAPAHEQKAQAWIFQPGTNATDGQLQANQRGAGRSCLDAEPRQKTRNRQRVDETADRKSGDDDASDRQAGFTQFKKKCREIRKQSEHAATFDEDGGIARSRSDWRRWCGSHA